MVGMEHVVFQHVLADLSPRLTLKTDLTHPHQSLRQHVKLVRVANAHVRSLDEVNRLHLKSDSNPQKFGLDLQTHRHLTGLLSRRPMKPCRYGPSSWCPPLSLCQCRRRCVWRSRPRWTLWLLNPWPAWGGPLSFPIASAFGSNSESCWLRPVKLGVGSVTTCGNTFALTFCIESSLPRCRGPVNVNRERTTALRTQPPQRAFL